MWAVWTIHSINSRDKGYKDYRDSPPVGAQVSEIKLGTLIIEQGEENDPAAWVLRELCSSFEEGKAVLRELNERWEAWLHDWKVKVSRHEGGGRGG